MAGLDDMIRSSVPGGNIGKPLMIALGALLASGVLFRGSGAGQSTSAGSQPTSDEGAGGLLGGLGGLLNKLQQGGLGNVTNCRAEARLCLFRGEAWPEIGGQAAHQRRGPADRGQHRKVTPVTDRLPGRS